mgnify:CR=1 FL=1|jgi:dTDP-4-dehydrorhamnose 3,5-epimerase
MEINGVVIEEPKSFVDERGKLLRMVRKDSPLFDNCSEIYFSVINPNVIKGWKKHLKMTQLFSCPSGNIKLVIFDDRPQSTSFQTYLEVNFGEQNHKLIKVPPGVFYAFKCESDIPAVMVNCANMIHDDNEVVHEAIDSDKISYPGF